MSRDKAVKNWLASMSKAELVDECFYWHDEAILTGLKYNQLQEENTMLWELCSELLHMAESADPEWLHWPELHDELRKLQKNQGEKG